MNNFYSSTGRLRQENSDFMACMGYTVSHVSRTHKRSFSSHKYISQSTRKETEADMLPDLHETKLPLYLDLQKFFILSSVPFQASKAYPVFTSPFLLTVP